MKRAIFIVFLLVATQALPLDIPTFRLGEDPSREEFKRGLTYKNLRQYSNAKDKFQRAISLKKDFDLARLELANTYFLSGEWETALDELEILSSQKPQDLLIQNKIEVLRLAIAGGNSKLERTYFKTIHGDEFRGFRFRNPVDVVFDEEGFFYIAGFETSNVIQFNPNGNPISNWKGTFTKKWQRPVALHYREGKLYVLDFGRDEVFILDRKGNFLSSFGSSGGGDGQFRGPSSIAFDSKGDMYVTDSGNNRIQKFNDKGVYAYSWGDSERDGLRNPSGIFIYEDRAYVVDKDNARICVYDLEGNRIEIVKKAEWKKPRSIRILENEMIISDELTGIWSYALELGEWKKMEKFRDKKQVYRVLDRPFAVNIDSTGTLFAVDYARHRVDVFTSKTNLVTNLDLRIESIDSTDFPNIHIITKLKYRNGKEVLGADRLAFRLYENENMTPLFSLLQKEKLNEKMNVAFVFENSKELVERALIVEDSLTYFFKGVNDWDNLRLIRSGKDSSVILASTRSQRDFIARIRESMPEKKWNLGKAGFEALSFLSKEIGPKVLV